MGSEWARTEAVVVRVSLRVGEKKDGCHDNRRFASRLCDGLADAGRWRWLDAFIVFFFFPVPVAAPTRPKGRKVSERVRSSRWSPVTCVRRGLIAFALATRTFFFSRSNLAARVSHAAAAGPAVAVVAPSVCCAVFRVFRTLMTVAQGSTCWAWQCCWLWRVLQRVRAVHRQSLSVLLVGRLLRQMLPAP